MIRLLRSFRFWNFNWFSSDRTIHVPQLSDYGGIFQGIRKVAQFSLLAGRWVVFAKASAIAHGSNDRQVDLRLKILGIEGEVTNSDEAYASASPSLGASMIAILNVDVSSLAHVEVNVGAQSAQAEFKHIVVTAIREP